MPTISYETLPSTFSALRLSPAEFAQEIRGAACAQWYAQGVVSQGKAAEIANSPQQNLKNIEKSFIQKVAGN